MALPSRTQQLLYSAESSFAEYAETPSSATWSTNLPIVGEPIVTLTQERMRDASVRARMNEENLSLIGPRSAELEFTTHWPGHNTTCAGSLVETWAQDLLSDGLGGGSTANVGTTISGTASTATAVNVTSAAALTVGNAVRIGSKGDGKGDGQMVVVGTVDTAPTPDQITLLTAAPAAPTTNAHVVYAAQVAYHDETTSATLGTKRFLYTRSTANAQWMMFGGQLAGLRFEIPVGGTPTITWRYRFAYWQRQAVTFPVGTALSASHPAPSAGGSVFINDLATATRNTITPSRLDLSLDLGLEPVSGPGGAGTYQTITAWQRTMCKPTLAMDIPWELANAETFWDQSNAAFTYKHVLVTLNPTDGKAVGFYLPRLFPIGNRPTVTSVNGQNYVPVTFLGVDGPTTTTELTQSAIRFYMA